MPYVDQDATWLPLCLLLLATVLFNFIAMCPSDKRPRLYASGPAKNERRIVDWTMRRPMAGINGGQTMDNPWINAASREFTVSSIACAYRAELILGR